MKFIRVLILLACVIAVQSTVGQPYMPQGSSHYCLNCPPGTKVQEHCTDSDAPSFISSTCIECPRGYYADDYNSFKHCQLCKAHCPKNGIEIQNCTSKTNLECLCHPGYHRYPIDHIDPNWICREHTKCKEDEIEESSGNHTHNRVCQKCGKHEFVNNITDPEHPVCSPCQLCDEKMTCPEHIIVICNGTANATYDIVARTTESSLGDNVTSTNNDGEQGKSELIVLTIVLPLLAVAIVVAAVCVYRSRTNKNKRNDSFAMKDIKDGVGTVRPSGYVPSS